MSCSSLVGVAKHLMVTVTSVQQHLIQTGVHAHTHTCTHTHVHTHEHTRLHNMYACTHTHKHNLCMFVSPHIGTFTSIRICIYPYVHMYTHTCECNLHMFTCSVINTCEIIHTIEENPYRVPCMHTHPCMPRAHIHTCSQIHSHINRYTYI